MRDFLDEILAAIESESLTDEEFETIELEEEAYNLETYNALKAVIEAREGVSGQAKRLKFYFIARGLDLSGITARTPNSNIYIGSAL